MTTTRPPSPNDEDERPGIPAGTVTERSRPDDAEDADAAEGTGDTGGTGGTADPRRSRFGRKGGKARTANEPEGWRTGPAWQEMRRAEQGPWRGHVRTVLIVAAVAVATLVAVNPSGIRTLASHHDDASDSSPLAPGTTPTTATATTAPSVAADPNTPTVSNPFAGSPALHWADGADGVVVPPATPTGDLTKRQVAAVLRTTKAYLVATNLDPAELRGGEPTAALRLVDPINGSPSKMKAALRSPSAKADPAIWFTRYDPARFALVGSVVKVHGQMTFAKADHGSVLVHTDYTYVYAFTQVGKDNGRVARIIVRRVADAQWYPGSTPGEVQIVKVGAELGGSGCGFHDGYLHPFTVSKLSAFPWAAPTMDPYDRTKPLDSSKKCQTTTRT